VFHVLVVEDDVNSRRLMEKVLNRAGYETHSAKDGADALDIMENQHIDIIVLDIMMPNMDGYELTKQLRDCRNELPILMVSAMQLPEDKRRGFLVGTDDYMTKPVDEEEFLLRIKALLRRAKIVSERKLTVGQTVLDFDSLTVTRGSESLVLPQKEFYLLYKLLSYPGKIFTRLQLMDEIWGMESKTGDSTVTVHINRLRKRFDGWNEFELVAVRGLGYKAVKKV